jgi:hypothetical protein
MIKIQMSLGNIELPSNKKFGLFFSAIFGAIAVYLYSIEMQSYAFALVLLVIATLSLVIVKSEWLLPFNKLWMYFGMLLGKIVSPIVLGAIYFLLFTPIGLAMRLVGRDEMWLKVNNRDSHWRQRLPIGPGPISFKNQF